MFPARYFAPRYFNGRYWDRAPPGAKAPKFAGLPRVVMYDMMREMHLRRAAADARAEQQLVERFQAQLAERWASFLEAKERAVAAARDLIILVEG